MIFVCVLISFFSLSVRAGYYIQRLLSRRKNKCAKFYWKCLQDILKGDVFSANISNCWTVIREVLQMVFFVLVTEERGLKQVESVHMWQLQSTLRVYQ